MISDEELESMTPQELEKLQYKVSFQLVKKIYNIKIIPTNRGFNSG